MGIASSTVGFLLWNYAGALLPAERLGLFLYLIPAVCVAAGAQLLNESLTLPILIGGALTVFGVWIASRAAAPDAAILESTRKLARIPFAANIFRGKSPAPRPPTGRPKEDAQGLTPGARRSRKIVFLRRVMVDGVFSDLVRHIESGHLRPMVASVHPLSAIVEAQQEFLEKRHTGKIVLIP
jgi:hypothetical protein